MSLLLKMIFCPWMMTYSTVHEFLYFDVVHCIILYLPVGSSWKAIYKTRTILFFPFRWHNHLNPDIKRDAWTLVEELALMHAHRMHGNKWAEIAKALPGRYPCLICCFIMLPDAVMLTSASSFKYTVKPSGFSLYVVVFSAGGKFSIKPNCLHDITMFSWHLTD